MTLSNYNLTWSQGHHMQGHTKDLTLAKDLILEDNKVGYTKTNISLPLCQNLIVDI